MRCANLKMKPVYTKPVHLPGPISEAELPEPGCMHWSGRRKALVVAAVEKGLLSRVEACERYSMSEEEYLTWKDSMRRFGPNGLLATRAQTIWNMTRH